MITCDNLGSTPTTAIVAGYVKGDHFHVYVPFLGVGCGEGVGRKNYTINDFTKPL